MISVMTFNIRFGLADDGMHSWEHRKAAVASLLRQENPDFIAVQEVNDFQADFLRERLPEYGSIGQRRPAAARWQSNVILHRRGWKCLREDFFFLSRTPSVPSRFAGSRWPRQCIIGHFRRNRRHVICVNTHLDFDETVQIRSARLILERLQRFPAKEPAILMGDFNATPDDLCYRVLTQEAENEESRPKAGFVNVFSPPYPGTYHEFSGKTGGEPIDWILFRGPLRLRGADVLTHRVEGKYPSDHFPVRAVFEMGDGERSAKSA